MQHNQDEIDLRLIFSRVERGISRLFFMIKQGVRYVYVRKLYFFVWILMGGFVAGGAFYLKKPIYSSSLTIHSYILSNRYCADLLETLDQLAKEKSYKVLAGKLNISPDQAAKIHSIKFRNFDLNVEEIDDFELDKDSINIDVPFKILVDVKDNSILDTLQAGLINFFESNPYANKRKHIKVKYLQGMSEKFGLQIEQIDTLKRTIEAALGHKNSSQGIVLMQQSIDPINTYREVISMYQEQLSLNEQVDLVASVEIIEGFTQFSKPSSPKLYKELLIFCSVFFFLGVLISLVRKEQKNSVIAGEAT